MENTMLLDQFGKEIRPPEKTPQPYSQCNCGQEMLPGYNPKFPVPFACAWVEKTFDKDGVLHSREKCGKPNTLGVTQ
jgi:hypothetical protein